MEAKTYLSQSKDFCALNTVCEEARNQEFISRLQISNIQCYSYHFFLLSYICNKTRVRCLGCLLTTRGRSWGAELGQHLVAECLAYCAYGSVY